MQTAHETTSGPAAAVGDAAAGGQPDPLVRGKGLASASGVKRPSFLPQQVVVGSSVRCFYGSPISSQRHFTWELIDKLFYNAPTLPWLIMGDLNSFLSYNDKEGSTYYDNKDMDAFSNFLTKFHLSPLPCEGNKFTWKNSSVKERLDWAIISESWSELFPDAVLHHLSFFGSDHRALKLILKDDSCNSSSKRFVYLCSSELE
ncbi:hypothetical protein G4B88_025829 [Cannabis sativa]|uniref:Endonuclease/exonuclease/phosphatase domain-containing protein n=1 Tax=Cannabis sativa TaxID=3483 RepID=A0A7J6G5S7_CANSA|nr:hypothetical protein G4B88_025829 [Cannabis sativa]